MVKVISGSAEYDYDFPIEYVLDLISKRFDCHGGVIYTKFNLQDSIYTTPTIVFSEVSSKCVRANIYN